ncbi:zinc finger protein 431-like [Sabethes cyaneus]|uniref:zinc finger protein 431-like n=1 Tax=Sabethes cyaneus TaxID=53552 RepID=UPI00237EBE70|nr:zinc finger protein 431-like [Sabethes cyaneus]
MDKYCRVCARSDEFKEFPLETVSQISDVRIDDMLIYCTQLEVTIADNLPQQICAECLTVLNSAFTFRRMCFHSDSSFRKMIEDVMAETEEMVVPPDEQDVLIPMTSANFSEICIKQENLATEDFFDSIVAGAELEDLPAPYQMLHDEPAEMVQSGARKRKEYHAFVCDTCNYSTSNRFNFNRHQKTMNHSGSRVVSLSKPVQSSRRKRKMKMGRIIQYNKKFTCEDCGYQNDNQFNYKRHLTSGKHLKNSFLRLNPGTLKMYFQCDFCNKNCLKRHAGCKRLCYFAEGVPPECFGFVPRRVIQDTLEIAKLTLENGSPIFTTDNANQQSDAECNRPPLKLIELVIDFVHCYAISVHGFRCCKCSVFFANPGALKKHRSVKHPVRRISGDTVNQCGRCYHPFLSDESFQYHKQLEHSKWLIFCIACQVMLAGNTAWNAHSHFHHGKKTSFGSFEMIVVGEKFRCCSCDYILDSQEALETHQTEVHFPDWQNSLDSLELHECEKCFKQFATVKQLASHVELRMSKRLYRCLTPSCRMEFKSEQEVSLHANNCFKQEPTANVSENQQIDRKMPPLVKYSYNQCGMTADTDQLNEGHIFSEVQLITHESTEQYSELNRAIAKSPSLTNNKNPTDETDEHEGGEENSTKKQRTVPVEKQKCNQCGKRCPNANALKLHVLKSHSKLKFMCTTCGKCYKDRRTLIRHKSIHNNFLRFQCSRCPFKTSSQGFLRVHSLKCHSKRRKTEPSTVGST